ncbi:MAG: TonB family protein [Nitrospira sp.]|nr:MAG: TonB family protein [Nitrospira sp.]
MQARIVERRWMEGWGFSLILHGVLLGTIVPAFRHLPTPTYSEPFQWNVIFTELSQQTTPKEPGTNTAFSDETLRTTEVEAHGSISSPTDVHGSPKQPKKHSAHLVNESSNTGSQLAAPPTPSTTQMAPATEKTLPGEQSSTHMTASPVSNEASAQPEAPVEQEIPAPPTSATDTTMAPTQSMDAPPASSSPTPAVVSDQPSSPQTDYSWLQRAVSRRLEELKRSSRPSLDNSSRLKVLVKAIVSSTGELMEAEVVKSSGLSRIDQEAMTLVQRAFPMPLDHTLDRQQIVMRIPITYSRD